MALKDEYQHVAERSLTAARAALNAAVHEKATFLCYHAFESTGCALSSKKGLSVGEKVSHPKKINIFTGAMRQATGRYSKQHCIVLKLAIILSSLRNQCLYPLESAPTGSIKRPEKAVTLEKAKELCHEVERVASWVEKLL